MIIHFKPVWLKFLVQNMQILYKSKVKGQRNTFP